MSMSYTNAATYSITAQSGVFGKWNILLWGPSAVQHLGKSWRRGCKRDLAKTDFLEYAQSTMTISAGAAKLCF